MDFAIVNWEVNALFMAVIEEIFEKKEDIPIFYFTVLPTDVVFKSVSVFFFSSFWP